MKQHIIDEKTGIPYTLHSDYYLPDLELPEQKPVGIWGQQHLQYLKQHRKAIYDSTETLKATDQMEWVRQMNVVRAQAAEIVNNEIMYTQEKGLENSFFQNR